MGLLAFCILTEWFFSTETKRGQRDCREPSRSYIMYYFVSTYTHNDLHLSWLFHGFYLRVNRSVRENLHPVKISRYTVPTTFLATKVADEGSLHLCKMMFYSHPTVSFCAVIWSLIYRAAVKHAWWEKINKEAPEICSFLPILISLPSSLSTE